MSRKRLGYLVPQFPGQTHVFFWREIRALEAMGIEVELISTRRPPPGLIAHEWSAEAMARTTYLSDRATQALLPGLLRLPGLVAAGELAGEPRALWRDLALAAPAARVLLQLVRARGITHLHVHSCGRAALVAALARRMGGPPYGLTLHGPLSDYGPGQRLKWGGADFGTVITRKLEGELREALGAAVPERLEVRPMGVETEAFRRKAPYEPPRAGEPLRLFCCGRLNVVKGHQDLMEAVRLLRAGGREVMLEIAGEDDDGGAGYRKVLEARIEELGLADAVRLLGAIDAEAVKARLEAAHVFVLASWHEPLGVAYMEAMSMEVPTIGTQAGGVTELIRDEVDGMLVSPREPEALAAAIAQLADDPALARRLSAAGRRRVEEGFRASLGAEALAQGLLGLGRAPARSHP